MAADFGTFLHSVRHEQNTRRRGRFSFHQSADRGLVKQRRRHANRHGERGSRAFPATCRHTRDPEDTVPGVEGGSRNPRTDSCAGSSDAGRFLAKERVGVADRGRLRGSGNGYQTLKPSSRVRKRGDGLPGAVATYLHGLREITAASFTKNVLVDTKSLDIFSLDRIHDPRSPDLFAGPLIVVHQSPPALTGRIRVAISEEDAVFNETFYGYSPRTHGEAGLLVRYIALVLGSKLAIWFALVTSGKFGFERDVVEKATLDRIPLPDFDKLTPQQRGEIERLVEGLQSGEVSWEEVDEWVMRLYGLSQRDLQVVFDTLEFNLPFAENKRNAQAVPSSGERERFCEVLRDELRPWCDRFGSRLAVDQIPPLAMSPWQAIAVRPGRREPTEMVPADDWAGLLRAADEAAASEILVDNGPDGLLIGRLAQRRYWSETQGAAACTADCVVPR